MFLNICLQKNAKSNPLKRDQIYWRLNSPFFQSNQVLRCYFIRIKKHLGCINGVNTAVSAVKGVRGSGGGDVKTTDKQGHSHTATVDASSCWDETFT